MTIKALNYAVYGTALLIVAGSLTMTMMGWW